MANQNLNIFFKKFLGLLAQQVEFDNYDIKLVFYSLIVFNIFFLTLSFNIEFVGE